MVQRQALLTMSTSTIKQGMNPAIIPNKNHW